MIYAEDSANFWLKNLEQAGFSEIMPKTVFISYDHAGIEPIFDQETPAEYVRLYDAVESVVRTIGLPSFIRTDISSAKHGGPKDYLIDNIDDFNRALCKTLQYTHLKTLFEELKASSILVRQFLTLEHSFTGFKGLPIANEWRYFSDGNTIRCKHPYWPPSVVEKRSDDPDWKIKLAEYQGSDDLDDIAIKAAKVQGEGSWSVDFAKDKNGKWWLIDMATAGHSYHWPGCIA